MRACAWRFALIAVFAFALRGAAGIDAKCSACAAVASELQTVLDAVRGLIHKQLRLSVGLREQFLCRWLTLSIQPQEKPRDPLDFRGRLDSRGERFGKVVDYRLSELRLVELLDGLCARLKSHALWTPSAAYIAAHPGQGAGRQWVSIKGENAHTDAQADDAELKHGGARTQQQQREIQGYCATLLESVEERLAEEVRREGDALNASTTERLLCRTLTPACRGVKRRRAGETEPAAGPPEGSGVPEWEPPRDAEL